MNVRRHAQHEKKNITFYFRVVCHCLAVWKSFWRIGKTVWIIPLFFLPLFIIFQIEDPPIRIFLGWFLLVFARWQTVPRPGKPGSFLLFHWLALKFGTTWVTSVETKEISVSLYCRASVAINCLFRYSTPGIAGDRFVSETGENDVFVIW